MQNELTNQDEYQVLSADELTQIEGGRPGGQPTHDGPMCGPVPFPYTDPETGITIWIY